MLTLKNELKDTLIIVLLLVVVAILTWSPETSLFFVASLGFHEMGHMLPILASGIPAYLTVALLGIGTVSDIKQRAQLSEFRNGLIHLGGPAFNLIFAAVVLAIYQNDATHNEYWLRLANTNALIGFVNILVIDEVSDGGKFIDRLFNSMPEWADNALMVFMSIASAILLGGVAITKGESSIIWIIAIAVWVIISLFRADNHDDGHDIPVRAMNSVEQVLSVAVYLLMWGGLFLILVNTPFMIGQDQAAKIVENVLTLIIVYGPQLVPLVILMVLVFISLTLPHELGHYLAGRFVGIRTNRLVMGAPHGSPWLKFSAFGLPVEFYRWPVMAAVDVDDDSLRDAPLPANAVFSMAGPAVNIILAFVVVAMFVGLQAAANFVAFVSLTMVQFVGAFVFGWLGLFGGSQFFFEAFNPINGLASSLGLPNLALVFAILHIFVAVANLLPIPGLDGGWILMSLVIDFRSAMAENRAEVSRQVYAVWLSFATTKLLKIMLVGGSLLTIIHFGVYFLH